MPCGREHIRANLERVRERIARAAERSGRDPASVRLIAITKSVGVEEAQVLRDLGVTDMGENRVPDAFPKIAALPDVRWHMVGTVQRRKARDVAARFHAVDSVDRLELAETLDRRCAEMGKKLAVLLQVNVSGESVKHGFTPTEVESALARMAEYPYLQVQGLMTMAPLVIEPEAARPVFAGLRELARRAGLAELSMGMTNDFEVAVEEGATQVRIGSALFG